MNDVKAELIQLSVEIRAISWEIRRGEMAAKEACDIIDERCDQLRELSVVVKPDKD